MAFKRGIKKTIAAKLKTITYRAKLIIRSLRRAVINDEKSCQFTISHQSTAENYSCAKNIRIMFIY